MNKYQQEYNTWIEKTNVSTQEFYSGGKMFSDNEEYFVEKFSQKKLLDIGCGTGIRTFPQYQAMNIDFLGLEKFPNVIDASPYKQFILQGDIATNSFQEIEIMKNERFDLSVFMGGVVNGLIDEEARMTAWKNIGFLTEKVCNFVLFDTITSFQWYETAQNGQVEKLHTLLPPQYFYSKSEIERLLSENNLKVEEMINESFGNMTRTHFLINSSLVTHN